MPWRWWNENFDDDEGSTQSGGSCAAAEWSDSDGEAAGGQYLTFAELIQDKALVGSFLNHPTHIRGLITPLKTTHEPPSMPWGASRRRSCKATAMGYQRKVDWRDLPSSGELVKAMQAVHPHKASGPDLIPPFLRKDSLRRQWRASCGRYFSPKPLNPKP